MRDFITTASSFAGMPFGQDPLGEGDQNLQSDPILAKEDLKQSLKKRLFKVGKQKKGDAVSLNPQALKDLYRLVRMELTPSEQSQIAIYELQTFIIEQCIKPSEAWRDMTFEVFIHFLLNWIRLEPDLWLKSSEQHQKINKKLLEKFGQSMGAEGTQIQPPQITMGPY